MHRRNAGRHDRTLPRRVLRCRSGHGQRGPDDLHPRPSTSTFTISVFSTVGFGDISPRTDTARLIFSAQMPLGLIIMAPWCACSSVRRRARSLPPRPRRAPRSGHSQPARRLDPAGTVPPAAARIRRTIRLEQAHRRDHRKVKRGRVALAQSNPRRNTHASSAVGRFYVRSSGVAPSPRNVAQRGWWLSWAERDCASPRTGSMRSVRSSRSDRASRVP